MPSSRLRRIGFFGAIALASLASLSGCATAPPASDPDAQAQFQQNNDPLEPTNRVFYAINNGIDTVVLRPLAVAYRYAFPQVVRTHTHNFLTNLSTPVVLANDIVQARPRAAGNTLMRGLINTTVGVGGVFDVATDWGYPGHLNDFGITMAMWGLPEGPFLFVPLLGPSNPRDLTGFGVDVAIDPLTWVGKGTAVTALKVSRFGVAAVDARERVLDDVDNIKKTALDPYATFRSIYRQNRRSTIERAMSDDPSTVPAWFRR